MKITKNCLLDFGKQCRLNQKLLSLLIFLLLVFVFNNSFADSHSISFKKCSVKVGAQEVDAECGSLKRLENPNDPKSKVLDLAVVKFASRSLNPEEDAFTLIQGGPGGSSIDLAVSYLPVLEPIRNKRDIIVIDQRGTGRSNKLSCPEAEDSSGQFDIELIKQETQKCLTLLTEGNVSDNPADHAANNETNNAADNVVNNIENNVVNNIEKNIENNDLRFYTTSIAVDDLEALRVAAGYPKLNIYGVSYGTRVAQHYLRKYSSATRSIILDGVVPIGLNLAGGEVARRWEDSFNGLNKRCSNNENCLKTHGDLKKNYQNLKTRFTTDEITVNIPHPRTGVNTEYTFDQFSLFSALRLMTYNTEQLSLIPILLSEAIKGNYTFAAAQIMNVEETLSTGFANGMHNSIICTEDAPFVTEKDIKQAKDTLIGELMSDAIIASCSVWPKGIIDDDFLLPFSSDVPVLILSGETDPITPAANGESAAKMLSNSKHIIVPAHGHGVLARGCIPKLMSLFITDANFDSIDDKCVKRERVMPIFSTSTGPKP